MKIGRNDPCACGSGTKSKKCCESPEAIKLREEREKALAAERRRAREAAMTPAERAKRQAYMMSFLALAGMSMAENRRPRGEEDFKF